MAMFGLGRNKAKNQIAETLRAHGIDPKSGSFSGSPVNLPPLVGPRPTYGSPTVVQGPPGPLNQPPNYLGPPVKPPTPGANYLGPPVRPPHDDLGGQPINKGTGWFGTGMGRPNLPGDLPPAPNNRPPGPPPSYQTPPNPRPDTAYASTTLPYTGTGASQQPPVIVNEPLPRPMPEGGLNGPPSVNPMTDTSGSLLVGINPNGQGRGHGRTGHGSKDRPTTGDWNDPQPPSPPMPWIAPPPNGPPKPGAPQLSADIDMGQRQLDRNNTQAYWTPGRMATVKAPPMGVANAPQVVDGGPTFPLSPKTGDSANYDNPLGGLEPTNALGGAGQSPNHPS